jgi:hypothetical protein
LELLNFESSFHSECFDERGTLMLNGKLAAVHGRSIRWTHPSFVFCNTNPLTTRPSVDSRAIERITQSAPLIKGGLPGFNVCGGVRITPTTLLRRRGGQGRSSLSKIAPESTHDHIGLSRCKSYRSYLERATRCRRVQSWRYGGEA